MKLTFAVQGCVVALVVGLSGPVLAQSAPQSAKDQIVAAVVRGPAGVEEAVRGIATRASGQSAAEQRRICREIVDAYRGQSAAVVDAANRGLIRAGNRNLATCVADALKIAPAAIGAPRGPEVAAGSPG